MSEKDSCDQIHRVVTARVPPSRIVVGRAAVKTCVPRVLRGELQVLPWPVREVCNVARTSRVAIRTTAHRALLIEERIDGTRGVEPTKCARSTIAKMVFGIGHKGVQMVTAGGSCPQSGHCCQIRIFANVCASERKHICSEQCPIDLGVHRPVCKVILQAGYRT